MLYSIVPLLALAVNIILNFEYFMLLVTGPNGVDLRRKVKVRYGLFLMSANCFFVTEIAWGFFYDYRHVSGVFAVVYSVTVFYFVFMLLTMLTWSNYVVAYLDERGRNDYVMTLLAWMIFILGLLCLMFNRFYHFIFYFNEAHDYVPAGGRHITFVLQFLFYAVVSVYMLVIAHRAVGVQKVRYKAVAFTSMALGLFMFLQILTSFYPLYVVGLLIGICIVRSFVEAGEKREKQIRDHISAVMTKDYKEIYYIDLETGEYLEFDSDQEHEPLTLATPGKDFFNEFRKKVADHAFSEDKEAAEGFFNKETMLNSLEGKRSFSCKYRFMVYGEPRFFLITFMYGGDEKHLILYEKDIQDELIAEKMRRENQKKTVTFSQIAESLASNYDEIYYVDIETSEYVGYESNNIYGQLEISKSGEDFFGESLENIPHVVHKQDCDMLSEFIDKDGMITALEDHKVRSINYRILVNQKIRYVRLTARKSSDGTHFIIGVENIDAEINREKQHLKALKTEKELARRDELTGTKNKTAYKELEASVQSNITHGMDYLPFGLIVCDANNLKLINDTKGHVAGDEYIKASAKMLCDIFVHSPVFRVGGDEFVVFLRGSDYAAKDELMEKLRNQVVENQKTGNGAVLASGMSEYDPQNDSLVSEIFDRADKAMYENKQQLKAM